MANSRAWSIPGLQDWGEAFGMAYGNARYVVIGDTNYAGNPSGRQTKIWYSDDSIIWCMAQPIGVIPVFDFLSFANDRFYACSSTEKYESTDGITWTVTTDFANPLMLVYSGGTYLGLDYTGHTFYGAHPASLTQILTVLQSGTKIKVLANGQIAVFSSSRLWFFSVNTLYEDTALMALLGPGISLVDVESVGTKTVIAMYDSNTNTTTLYYKDPWITGGVWTAAAWPGADTPSLNTFDTLASDGTTIIAYNKGDTFGLSNKHIYYSDNTLVFTAVNLAAVAPIYATGLVKCCNGIFFYAGEISEGTEPSGVVKSADGAAWTSYVTFAGTSTDASVAVFLPGSYDEAGTHPASYNVTLTATNDYGFDSEVKTINLTETP